MKGHRHPTGDKAERIANIRLQLYDIHKVRKDRDLTIAEAYQYQQLNLELQRLMEVEGADE